ncbi:MAG: hypothetical protein PUH30_03755 [Oscillospiraceae bacterium]|nr:hypothetical protein [Oscillospiraceae bacterium]MDD7278630.1 hypothetical protein [Oscillospiraceae bacterium]
MTDEMIVRIKRPIHLKAPLKYADEYAVVQFSREELNNKDTRQVVRT